MTQKVSLVFFNLDNSIPLVKDLWSHYQKDRDFEILSMKEIGELNQYLMISMNGIIFFKVMNKEDLQSGVEILKAHRKLIKRGLLRAVCILGIRNKKIDQILAKHGCVDTLDPILKAKTVTYKIDMWATPILNSLGDIERQEALKKKHKEAMLAKRAAIKAAKDSRKDFIFTSPLDLASDFWILKQKNDCKKVLNKFLIRMLGPSSIAGEWVELARQPGEAYPTWKYVEKEESGFRFLKDDGTWFFYGTKPEFDWKVNRWVFSGTEMHLFFYYKDGRNFSRFKTESHQVIFAENSQFGFNQESFILETCDPKYNIDVEKIPEDQKSNINNSDEVASDLVGHSKTDDINGGPLSGKGAEEEIDRSPLDGKSQTDHLNRDPLSGKNQTDSLNHNPLAGQVNPNDIAASNQEHHMKKDGVSNDLSGQGNTDHLKQDPLKGRRNPHDIATSEDGSSAKKHSSDLEVSKDERIDDSLGGRVRSDELGRDPLGGNKNSHESSTRNNSSGEAEKRALTNNERGKGAQHSQSQKLNPHDLAAKEKREESKKSHEIEKKIDLEELKNFTPPIISHEEEDPFRRNVNPHDLESKESSDEEGDAGFSGVLENTQGPAKQPEDPFAGFDPHFDPFGLPNKKNFDAAFATNPSSFQTEKQKNPKKYMNLADYMDDIEGESSIDEQQDNTSSTRREEGTSKTPPSASIREEEVEKKYKDEDVGYATNWKDSKKIKNVSREGSSPSPSPSGYVKEEHEKAMLEALDGGLTERAQNTKKPEEYFDQNQIVDIQSGNLNPNKVINANLNDNLGLDTIIGAGSPVNLESGELKVVLKQKTEAGNDITFICGFEDFYEDELIVKAPKNSLPVKSEVLGNVTLSYKGQKIKVPCLGIIEEIEELNELEDTLIISISKIDKEKYDRFIDLYQERQGSIHEFMDLAKGYE